jgi:hypothetical protein
MAQRNVVHSPSLEITALLLSVPAGVGSLPGSTQEPPSDARVRSAATRVWVQSTYRVQPSRLSRFDVNADGEKRRDQRGTDGFNGEETVTRIFLAHALSIVWDVVDLNPQPRLAEGAVREID